MGGGSKNNNAGVGNRTRPGVGGEIIRFNRNGEVINTLKNRYFAAPERQEDKYFQGVRQRDMVNLKNPVHKVKINPRTGDMVNEDPERGTKTKDKPLLPPDDAHYPWVSGLREFITSLRRHD